MLKKQLKTRFSKFCSCFSVSGTITSSSAYNKEYICAHRWSLMFIHTLLSASLIYKLNSDGDNQSPCRMPQTLPNHSERSDPFSSIHDMASSNSIVQYLWVNQWNIRQYERTYIRWTHSLWTDCQVLSNLCTPDTKVHGANMGLTWILSAPDAPHVGPMNLAIRLFS